MIRPSAWLVVVVAAGVACQAAEVRNPGTTSPPGTTGGGDGGAPVGGPGALPGLMLPDASDAPAAPPPAPSKCAETSHQAERAPVDLLLLVDTSGSMTDSAGMRSKWAMVKDALLGFLKDPRSAGLSVGLQFFPLLPPEKACNAEGDCPPASPLLSRCHTWSACGKAGGEVAGAPPCPENGVEECAAGTTCLPVGRCSMSGKACLGMGAPCPGGMAGDTCGERGRICRYSSSMSCEQPYNQPVVPFGPLPQQEGALIAAIEARIPRGGTPMGPAVEGALAHLKAHVAARPERRAALVLVSDGLPDSFCSRNYIAPITTALAAGRAGPPPLSSYVIGVFSPEEVGMATAGLTQLAMAGGTGAPYLVNATDDLARRFQDALDRIRGTVLPCEFKIPAPATGAIDFGKVNVRVEGGAAPIGVPYVATKERCDPTRGGWHYDRDPATGAPQTVHLCPVTCDQVKADGRQKVQLLFGCQTAVIN